MAAMEMTLEQHMEQNDISNKPQLAIMYSDQYTKHLQYMGSRPGGTATASHLQVHKDRDLLLSSLLRRYILPPLMKVGAVRVVSPMVAGLKHMLKFHDEDYLNMVRNGPPSSDTDDPILLKQRNAHILDRYNLVDDCVLPDTDRGRRELWAYASAVAGASLHAAALLTPYPEKGKKRSRDDGKRPVTTAINWGGGRHHAARDMAGGFCYVNDAVLALQHMRRSLGKTLYLDIDIHHADGVEGAFLHSQSVVTVSFHKYGHGFFPGTGGAKEAHGSAGHGHFHTLNIPMPDGLTDADFVPFYAEAFTRLLKDHAEFSPTGEFKAVCLAVGADGLHDDPLVGPDGWALSTHGLSKIVAFTSTMCKTNKLPLLILGGGGYRDINAARTFAVCTVAACEPFRPGVLSRLPPGVPEHEFFPRYGPTFEIHTPGPTERGTYGGSDCGRRKKRMDKGMEDARAILEVSLGGLKNKATGGITFCADDDGEIEASEENRGEMNIETPEGEGADEGEIDDENDEDIEDDKTDDEKDDAMDLDEQEKENVIEISSPDGKVATPSLTPTGEQSVSSQVSGSD